MQENSVADQKGPSQQRWMEARVEEMVPHRGSERGGRAVQVDRWFWRWVLFK